MPPTVRAVRGATTVRDDTPEAVTHAVVALLSDILERNAIVEDDIISILFTATEDIVSIFPATAARSMGLGAVPLICARELSVIGSTPRCIRVMLHVTTDRPRDEIHHVYLEGAQGLRDDLPD
ncbi:MAG: chorismate mutase [Acidimicrobiales bacterium]